MDFWLSGGRERGLLGIVKTILPLRYTSGAKCVSFSTGEPVAFVEEFRNYYGPTMNTFDAAEIDGRALELRAALLELFVRWN